MGTPTKKRVRRKKAVAPEGKAVVKKTAAESKGPPATFDNWVDGTSQILNVLNVHVFTLKEQSDPVNAKLERMVEAELDAIVILLRKRIRAKSKKLDLGCRIM